MNLSNKIDPINSAKFIKILKFLKFPFAEKCATECWTKLFNTSDRDLLFKWIVTEMGLKTEFTTLYDTFFAGYGICTRHEFNQFFHSDKLSVEIQVNILNKSFLALMLHLNIPMNVIVELLPDVYPNSASFNTKISRIQQSSDKISANIGRARQALRQLDIQTIPEFDLLKSEVKIQSTLSLLDKWEMLQKETLRVCKSSSSVCEDPIVSDTYEQIVTVTSDLLKEMDQLLFCCQIMKEFN